MAFAWPIGIIRQRFTTIPRRLQQETPFCIGEPHFTGCGARRKRRVVPSYIDRFHEQGFAVIRGVFSVEEVRAMQNAFDRVYARAMDYGATFRHQNVLYRLTDDKNLGRIVRMVQWPSYVDPALAAIRIDKRVCDILKPLIGNNLKQIINQMHWKPPGAESVEFGYHQDIRFRRPRSAYRRPSASYIQTGIAVDPHSMANGAMVFCPGSHKRGEVNIDPATRVMDRPLTDADLTKIGIDPATKVSLDLAPGDLALWHLLAIHGSGENRAPIDRRLYINGYVIADRCDRGEWAFRNGVPIQLGTPVLVHYEQLYERPEPHYVDQPPPND